MKAAPSYRRIRMVLQVRLGYDERLLVIFYCSYDEPPDGSTGFVYVTFSTATFSLPCSSLRS